MEGGNGAIDPQPPQTLRLGEIVAEKYRIDRLIGSGGMAEVYAALNLRTGRKVALKWILPALATSREVLARFRREALSAGRIDHPNVVTIFDFVEHQGSACLVMELLDGEMLSDLLTRTGPMPFNEAVAIILPAMRGVAAAHAQGVIHRDLKPHNIFLCLDHEGSIRDCKVLDFGVSKLTVADAAIAADITLSGNVVGTPEYMAPEQIRSAKSIDHRIDVYALGVVLYQMLAGRPPFVSDHFSGLMLEIMQHDAPALASFRPDVPRRLAAVIHRAMARDVSKRFPDVATFMQALESVGRDDLKLAVGTPPEGLITRVGFPRPTPAVLTPMLPRPRERRRMRIGIAMGVALVATAAVAASLWTSGGAERRLARPAPSTTRPDPNADRSPRQANAPGAIPASRDPSAGASGPQPPAAAPAPAAPAVAVAPAPPTAAKAAATPTPAGSSATAHGIRRSTPRPLSDSGRTEVESTVPAPAPRVTVPRPAVGRAGKISVDDF